MDIWENSILGEGTARGSAQRWEQPGVLVGQLGSQHIWSGLSGRERWWEVRTEGHAEARWSRAVGHGKGLCLYRKPDRSHGSDMV